MVIRIKTEAKIGIIVLTTLLAVIWGINFLKGRNILKRTDVYYVVYDTAQGLEFAAPVHISGFKVGLINNIAFDKTRLDRIVVSFVVEKQYKIPRGSVVKVVSTDLLSGKSLAIELSDANEYHSIGDTLISGKDAGLIGKLQAGIDPVLQNAETSLKELELLLSKFNEMFSENSINDLQASFSNLNQVSGSLNAQLKQNGELNATISNLEKFSASLSNSRENLAHAITNIASITDTLKFSGMGETIGNLTNVSGELHILLNNINSGEGTLGMLSTNDSLYFSLVNATTSLDLLLQDLREKPKRYVHFSLFGKKDKK